MKDLLLMSKEELTELKARVDILLAVSKGRPVEKVELIYGEVSSILLKKLGTPQPDIRVLSTPNMRKIYRELVETQKFVVSWLSTALGRPPKANEKIKAYNLFADTMVDGLRDMKIHVSLKSLLVNRQLFPGFIDRYFPGYVAAGMLQFILRSKEQNIESIRRAYE